MISISDDAIILTDIHFGRKKFSVETFENTMLFLEKDVFPKFEKTKTIFILGDFWDDRKIMDWRLFNLVIERFFEPLKEFGVEVFMILGNHDIFFKDTLEVNSIEFLSKMYENINVITKETYVDFNSKKLLFVPWLLDDKFDFNSAKNADMILGHFEMRDFEMIAGYKSTSGLDAKDFNGIPVLSGHYHNKSENHHVTYLGVCEQMNWSDFNSHKGAHILKQDLSLEFIPNEVSRKHVKFIVNSSDPKPITSHGLSTRSRSFLNFTDVMKEFDLKQHVIKLILRDISEIIVYNNLKVQLDTNDIEYVILDETPEMLEKINLHEDEIRDDNIDLLSIFKSQLEEEELDVFLEVFNEATQELD